jgi:phosphoglycerate dehydrogenase-like enzyme
MNQLNLLISFDLPETCIQKIKAVSSNLRVQQSHDREELASLIKEADILFAGYFSREMFGSASRLKWIQTHLAGVERFLYPEVVDSQVIITNAGGVSSIPISEQVMGMMLCLSRKLHVFIGNQLECKWRTGELELLAQLEELAGKTVGIVGLGRIGTEIAKKAKCFGMRVIATKRKASSQMPSHVDKLVAAENLNELLAESDYLVLQLPLTRETQEMFGEQQFRSMKKTAYLINTGRGEVVKEDALIKALEEGVIAGAALDTFAVEPLPKDSPLWGMKNVIITPHVAGFTPQYLDRLTDLFCENLNRFIVRKEELINVVDKRRGY